MKKVLITGATGFLGTHLVNLLLEKDLVRDVADLYQLRAGQVAAFERQGDKSAQNLIEAIAASKVRTLSRLIYGLGIRFVGQRAAQIVAGNFQSIDELMSARLEDLEALPDVGPVAAASIVAFFERQTNRGLMVRLREAGVRVDEITQVRGDALDGKTFVLTGALPTYSRDEATVLIIRQGGRVTSAVSKKTDYVVAGADAGSKKEKAQKLGVAIITEAGLEELLEGKQRT